MELFKLGFLSVRLIDLLDVAIVSFLLYRLLEFVRTTFPSRILIFIISLFLLWRIVDFFKFRLLSAILSEVWGLGSIAFVILFAPEIRRILNQFADRFNIQRLLLVQSDKVSANKILLQELLKGLNLLKEQGEGALILLQGQDILNAHIQTSERLDATCTARLLVAIFQKNSPLHDGAVIIQNQKIISACSILPISKNTHLGANLGTRHRAALGITEMSDVFAIVLSEETGSFSFSYKGQLTYNCTVDLLEVSLITFLNG